MKSRLFLILSILSVVTGCQSAQTRTYDISVRNETGKELTVWLAKDGGPYEAHWASPEEIARERPGGGDAYWGIVIPAGKTGFTGETTGKFDDDSRAYLRVYSDVKTLSQLLAVGRGSANRLDLPLQEGKNDFIVSDGAKLSATRSGQPVPAK